MPKGEKNRKLSDADRAEIVRLYTTRLEDGTWMGTPTIARRYGVSNTTIAYTLRRAGVQRRDARESHAHGKRCKPIRNLPVGEPPLCGCGCGNPVVWYRPKNCWRLSLPGHRRTPPKPPGPGKSMPGPLNPSWKGGVTPERQRLYRSAEWRALVRGVFARDGYRCVCCQAPKKGKGSLHAHHVRPWADSKEDRMNPDNLITLCRKCHGWVHSKANGLGLYLAR